MSKRAVIVAGIDGSDAARVAARWAARDATRRGVPLRLVHAVQAVPIMGYPEPLLLPPRVTDEVQARARKLLRDSVDQLQKDHPGLSIEAVQQDGGPVKVLLEQARGSIATVVGTHGVGRFDDAVFGSVAARLAAHGEGCIVIARPDPARPDPARPDPARPDPARSNPARSSPARSDPDRDPDRDPAHESGAVVVGVDGSPASRAAIGFAYEEAALRGATLVAIHTWNDKPLNHALGSYPLDIDATGIDDQEQRLLET